MSLRSYLASKIAANYLYGMIPDPAAYMNKWSVSDCRAYLEGESKLHRFLVGLDMAVGQFGTSSPEDQDKTISCRTAYRCKYPLTCALWALIVGFLLETIEPRHLLNAMVADRCRARLLLGV